MSVFQNFQTVTLDIYVAIKVHFKESPHWDLVFATVFLTILLLVEVEVVFDWTTWVFRFLIDSWTHPGHDMPEADKQRDAGEESEENASLETTTDFP